MKKTTILLVEDHVILRDGMRALLQLHSDMEIIGEAGNGRQAVAMAISLSPQVVVMDIAMPLLNGMEATRQILEVRPATKMLILSAHSDDSYVEQVMALGASGYLSKQSAALVLPKAIRRVIQGEKIYSPGISKRRKAQAQKAHVRGELSPAKAAQLSSREMEVLQLIAEGMANKETATELRISVKTVEKHRQSLMDKLNIHDTASLTRHAIAVGIIESSVQVTIL